MKTPNAKMSGWPIAIASFFVVAIIFVVGFVVFAARQRSDLVRQDYYEEEIRFQNHMDRVSRTDALRGEVAIAYDPARQIISVALPAAHGIANPSGEIRLYRPSDARLDRAIPLAVDQRGTQRVEAKELASGLWKVRVQWRVNEQDFFFDQEIILKPTAGSARSKQAGKEENKLTASLP